ncbi:TPA: hypothetical protein HA235_06120 [Candidatus Woesearchaeota archaeon]|nr:hypothetical protein [Candidatus Woesearchaeota archaeon]HIH32256.1 hypothetical protein [Candidatus Woesearchaeota archaeon]HIH54786.1 hypothetical protein [Candidatus Woesearchaeota archaeon]HIJ01368.1 hypothetical protein [Candidatus Woesearchaeota archaeon]HIJ14412.1 hypothetical protein [Candidatus Woesearchaeota archaeon]
MIDEGRFVKLKIRGEPNVRYGFISNMNDNLTSFVHPIQGIDGEFDARFISDLKPIIQHITYSVWRAELKEILEDTFNAIKSNDYYNKIINERQKYDLDRILDYIQNDRNKNIDLDDLIDLYNNFKSTNFLVQGIAKRNPSLKVEHVLVMPYPAKKEFIESIIDYNSNGSFNLYVTGIPVTEPYKSRIDRHVEKMSVFDYQKDFKKR